MIRSILKFLRTKFITGFLVVVPIIATILALKFLFQTVDGLVGSLPEKLFGRHIPGIGVIVTTLVVFLMGLLASNYFGKKAIGFGEKFLTGIPLVNKIYTATKELMQAVTLPDRTSFKEVVLVEYPRKGLYVYGFVTSRVERNSAKGSERFVNVFIATTPVPTTGVLIAVPERDLVPINISVERALKLIVSGGIVSPKTFSRKDASIANSAAANKKSKTNITDKVD